MWLILLSICLLPMMWIFFESFFYESSIFYEEKNFAATQVKPKDPLFTIKDAIILVMVVIIIILYIKLL